MSMCFPTAQVRTKRRSQSYHGLGARHFTSEFYREIALQRCPCRFQPRRLAQSVGRCLIMILGPAGRGIFRDIFSYKIALVTCPCPILTWRSCGNPGAILYEVLVCSCTVSHEKFCRDPGEISPCAFWGWRCARQFFTIEWSQHNPKNCKFSHYRMVPFFQARLRIRLHKTALKRGARLC